MNVRRRRAIFLTEMLTVTMVFVISSGLIMMALEVLLEAHDRIADQSNRYAMINDLVHKLRSDVRRAESAEFSDPSGGDAEIQSVKLRRADGEAVYRVEGHRVTRSAVGPAEATCVWDDPDLSVRLMNASGPAGPADQRVLVRMILTWNPNRPHDTAPTREFDVTIAAAAERPNDGGRDD